MNPKHAALLLASLSASLAYGSNAALAEKEEWAFSVAPLYVWGKSIKASTTAGDRELPLDLEFKDDILENLDGAFAVHAEASKGALTLFAEYNYAKLNPTAQAVLETGAVAVDVDFTDIMAEGGMAWAVAETATLRWEVLAGLRYYDQDAEIKASLTPPGGQSLPRRLSVGDSWVHPFAGVRLISRWGENWTLRVRGDYGYEDSENSALQGIATVGYRFSDWGAAFLGYRYYEMDFSNSASGPNQYAFDGKQQGPLVGLTLHF